MMVKGKTRGDVNVRLTPVVVTGNISYTSRNISYTSRGIVEFTGELVTSAIDQKQWIRLITIGGVNANNSYIAAWVVDYTEIVSAPSLVHTIEVYSDGSLVIDGIPY